MEADELAKTEEFKPMARFIPTGRPGNTGYWGYPISGEHVANLDGVAGLRIYDKMRRSDSQIKTILRAIKLPILTAHYFLEPASTAPEDVRRAAILEDAILRGMSDSWSDTLAHILLYLEFGFSVLEMIDEYRGGLILPRILAPRLPLSIYRWITELDTGHLRELWQLDSKGSLYKIPIEKILLFTNDREGDNWAGISLLRPAYKDWVIKNELEKTDAIKHERYGVGVPIITARESAKPSEVEWEHAEAALERIQSHESGGIILPFGYKAEILTPSNAGGTDAIPSIRYHDEQIARSVLAMFASLGNTQTGSRSLGETFLDMFTASLQAYAQGIADKITSGLIKRIVRANWGDVPFPRMMVGPIKSLNAETLATLATAGLLTPDVDLEGAIRKSLSLPAKAATTAGAATGAATAGDVVDQSGTENKEAVNGQGALDAPAAEGAPKPPGGRVRAAPVASVVGPNNSSEVAGMSEGGAHVHGPGCAHVQLSEAVRRREMEYCGQFFDVNSYAIQLAGAEGALKKTLRDLRTRQGEAISSQLVQGKKIRKIVAPLKKEMFEALMSAWTSQRETGREQMKAELSKQGVRLGKAELSKQGVRLGKGDFPFGANILRTMAADELFAAAMEFAELRVSGAASKLETMIAEMYLTGRRKGLTSVDLVNYLSAEVAGISDVTWETIADETIGGGWNTGREEVAEYATKEGEVVSAHYTPIFDKALCDRCLTTYDAQPTDVDGDPYHGPGDPQFSAPNPDCEGGERCRCINVYLAGSPLEEGVEINQVPKFQDAEKGAIGRTTTTATGSAQG